ncbi:OmpA family protein [Flavobacterium sp. CAU 1735]|uniref:OmpA family protein n=1 Tax=Flavobacterium sp. CAU 1735 TaxID=3140361 RepID=UPI0032607D44
MKKQYITLGLLLLMTASYGQDKFTKEADKLFENYQYIEAIDEYLKLTESKNANAYVFTKLADSYYNISKMDEAEKWYVKAIQNQANAAVYYRYAQTLKALGNYPEANKQMDIFVSLLPNDVRSQEYKANPNYIQKLNRQYKMFDIATMDINSKDQSDFGAVLTDDNTLYFVSTRNTSQKIDKWVDRPYQDIYEAIRNSNGTFSEPKPVSELNTPFHDGPVTISSDGKTMYFARDGHSSKLYERNKDNVKISQQGIYKATKIDGKWTNIEALPFNSTAYSVTNPSLSRDGKTLYFASNMPGGMGESDIWRVRIDANGYGKPENLGSAVNTQEKENFPFIANDDILYYASSGKQGFGGLDLFKIDLKSMGQAVNLGKPINSGKDDFALTINENKNIGFFASNRSGKDAIYTAIPICSVEAIAMVTNEKTGDLIANASVVILDNKGNSIATKQSDSEGKARYRIDCEKAYAFLVTAPNFEPASFPVQKVKSREVLVKAPLSPIEEIIAFNPIYFDFDKKNITKEGVSELDKLITVMKNHPASMILIKSHTDSRGNAEYNQKLSEKRAQSTMQYLISNGIEKERISGEGLGSSEPRINCTNCTKEQYAKNRRSEFIIINK